MACSPSRRDRTSPWWSWKLCDFDVTGPDHFVRGFLTALSGAVEWIFLVLQKEYKISVHDLSICEKLEQSTHWVIQKKSGKDFPFGSDCTCRISDKDEKLVRDVSPSQGLLQSAIPLIPVIPVIALYDHFFWHILENCKALWGKHQTGWPSKCISERLSPLGDRRNWHAGYFMQRDWQRRSASIGTVFCLNTPTHALNRYTSSGCTFL